MLDEIGVYRTLVAAPAGLEEEVAHLHQIIREVNEAEIDATKRLFWPERLRDYGLDSNEPPKEVEQRLRESDYTVLILADRWGSPPAPDENPDVISATEWAYLMAINSLFEKSEPMKDLVVMFKGVPAERLVEPDRHLKKVLRFRADLEKKDTLFFSTFDSPDEFARLMRRNLTRWLREEDEGSRLPEPDLGQPPTVDANYETIDAGAVDATGHRPTAVEVAMKLVNEGKNADAERWFARAVDGDPENLSTRFLYARFLRHVGRMTPAIIESEKLVEKAKRQADPRWTSEGLGNLGVSQRRAGLVDRSRSTLIDAIAITSSVGGQETQLAYLENNLGLSIRRAGHLGIAEGHYTHALRIYESLRDETGLAYAHLNLSNVQRERGDLDAAREHANEVLKLRLSSESRARAQCNLGLIAEEEGDLEDAESHFAQALKLNSDLDSVEGKAMNYAHLARVQLRQGEEDGALQNAAIALELTERSDSGDGIALSLQVIGDIERRQKRLSVALERFRDARKIYESLAHRIGVAETWVEIAIVHWQKGEREEAHDAIGNARVAADRIDHSGLRKMLAETEEEIDPDG
jgi:tetratricopeptide (TPR) repeat protein